MQIETILNKAGGETAVAFYTGVTQHAVIRWKDRGIPEKYWEQIIFATKKFSGKKITIEELHKANKKIRKQDQ